MKTLENTAHLCGEILAKISPIPMRVLQFRCNSVQSLNKNTKLNMRRYWLTFKSWKLVKMQMHFLFLLEHEKMWHLNNRDQICEIFKQMPKVSE